MKKLSLRFNLFKEDWQQYLIDFIEQNDWLEELYVLGTGFTASRKRLLYFAWTRYLSSHRAEVYPICVCVFLLSILMFHYYAHVQNHGCILIRINKNLLRLTAPNIQEQPCPFCLSELTDYNSWRLGFNATIRAKYQRTNSIVMLQAFCRMIIDRLRYLKGRKVIVHLQRKYRAGVFWKRAFAAKVSELRPFRLRLHNLWMVRKFFGSYSSQSSHSGNGEPSSPVPTASVEKKRGSSRQKSGGSDKSTSNLFGSVTKRSRRGQVTLIFSMCSCM